MSLRRPARRSTRRLSIRGNIFDVNDPSALQLQGGVKNQQERKSLATQLFDFVKSKQLMIAFKNSNEKMIKRAKKKDETHQNSKRRCFSSHSNRPKIGQYLIKNKKQISFSFDSRSNQYYQNKIINRANDDLKKILNKSFSSWYTSLQFSNYIARGNGQEPKNSKLEFLKKQLKKFLKSALKNFRDFTSRDSRTLVQRRPYRQLH